MPNYYNPYNFYPATYSGSSMYPMNQQPVQMPQQSYAAPPAQMKAMEWVEGEVGAKAYQMPQGLPANQPIPLWDSTDTIIYLKSWGPMGIPNPLQKLRYEMPEQQNQALLSSGNQNTSGASASNTPDFSQFATKQDLEQMKRDLKEMLTPVQNSGNNQNGSNNRQNRGGGQ